MSITDTETCSKDIQRLLDVYEYYPSGPAFRTASLAAYIGRCTVRVLQLTRIMAACVEA